MEFLKATLGIELGSTRIKAVLIDESHQLAAYGSYMWENSLKDGIWTYSLDEAISGLQKCYQELRKDVLRRYGTDLITVGAIGISGMMHGYLPFNSKKELLTDYRTWRNTMTGPAAEALTELFSFNIPQRWSIAHLYQAMLNQESHVKNICYLTTLAGYIHWCLTGNFVIGVGDASGMFPIDTKLKTYDPKMLQLFREKTAKYPWVLEDILPRVLTAGKFAGMLTEEGARLLDISGTLQPGIPFCPPEGDAGTGMIASNAVTERTGNTSAGTSIFSMVVLEKPLAYVYPEIDVVTTPAGKPVAMIHCNNCTSDINSWAKLFREFGECFGITLSDSELYDTLFKKAMEGKCDCDGLLSYNYISGEWITHLDEGRPIFLRRPDSEFSLANFWRTQLYSALATLRLGMDMLQRERIQIDCMYGHGGYFKTNGVGQKLLAAAIQTPVYVMETAGEGGPWGMAILAAFLLHGKGDESLEDYLSHHVFCNEIRIGVEASADEIAGFNTFLKNYIDGFPVEKTAIETVGDRSGRIQIRLEKNNL